VDRRWHRRSGWKQQNRVTGEGGRSVRDRGDLKRGKGEQPGGAIRGGEEAKGGRSHLYVLRVDWSPERASGNKWGGGETEKLLNRWRHRL